jgi:hypothetical protein
MKETSADHNVDEHAEAAVMCALVCEYVSASSFNVIGHVIMEALLATGRFTVRWVTA